MRVKLPTSCGVLGILASALLALLLSGNAVAADGALPRDGESANRPTVPDTTPRFFFALTVGGGISSDWLAYRSDQRAYDSAFGGYAELAFEPGVSWRDHALHLVLGYHSTAIRKIARGDLAYNVEARPQTQRIVIDSLAMLRAGIGYRALSGDRGLFWATRLNTLFMLVVPQYPGPVDTMFYARKGLEAEGAIGTRVPFGRRGAFGIAAVAGLRTTFDEGRAFPGVYLGARISLMVE